MNDIDKYSDEVMIAMYKKSLHENEEHNKWLKGVLATIDDKYKPYFRMVYNENRSHIKLIIQELYSYKTGEFYTKEYELAWENYSNAFDRLRDYLYSKDYDKLFD